jgi:hypothetical protein
MIINKASFLYQGNFSNNEKKMINNHLYSILNNINRTKIKIKKDKNLILVLSSKNIEITNFYIAEIANN